MAKLWIARDRGDKDKHSVYLFWERPRLNEQFGTFNPVAEDEDFMRLPADMFPDLTFEDSPKEVEITLK